MSKLLFAEAFATAPSGAVPFTASFNFEITFTALLPASKVTPSIPASCSAFSSAFTTLTAMSTPEICIAASASFAIAFAVPVTVTFTSPFAVTIPLPRITASAFTPVSAKATFVLISPNEPLIPRFGWLVSAMACAVYLFWTVIFLAVMLWVPASMEVLNMPFAYAFSTLTPRESPLMLPVAFVSFASA